MNEQDKQSALVALAILHHHFVEHQRGQQLLRQIEEIINKEEPDEAIETNIPPKKRRGRPRKSDNLTR